MGDGRVARHRFHLAHRRAMRTASQRLLNSAMLIAERDFQVQHLFAGALKTEMAGFDDAGMDRADGDFVNLPALHAKEFAVGGRIAVRASHRLEPRMAFRCEVVLLPDFALEQVCLRMRSGERRIAAGERLAAPNGESVVSIKGEHRNEAGAPNLRAHRTRRKDERRDSVPLPLRGQIPPPAIRAFPPRGCWWRWPGEQMEWRRSWSWKKLGDRSGPGFTQYRRGEKSEP